MIKKIILLFSIFTLSFSVTKVHALSFDFDDERFGNLTFNQLMEYSYSFINSNYDKVFCISYNTTYTDCYFGLKDLDLVVVENGTALNPRYIFNDAVYTSSSPFYIRFNVNGNQSPYVNTRPVPSLQTGATNISGKTVLYSNFDLMNYSQNTTYFTKNVDYSPPTCPACEESEECDNNMETTLYTLLILVSTLILMIFLKWTFGDRRR